MPVANARGETIYELGSDDPFFQVTRRLRVLKYPKDIDILKHLSYLQFFHWLHGLEPREALFLTNEKKFRIIQDHIKSKGFWTSLYDKIWRYWHGFDFEIR